MRPNQSQVHNKKPWPTTLVVVWVPSELLSVGLDLTRDED